MVRAISSPDHASDSGAPIGTLRPRNRYVKSLSLGLTDALFTISRFPWIIFDLVLVFLLFQVGMWVSPYGVWGQWTKAHTILDLAYTASFCSIALGLQFYDRVSRFDYVTIARVGVIASLVASFVSLSIFYFVYYLVVGRLTLVYGALAAFFGTFSIRIALAWLLRKNPYRFTIIGRSPCADAVIEFCAKRHKAARMYVYLPWSEIFGPGETPSVDRLLAAKVGDIVLTSEAMNQPDAIDFAIDSLKAKFRVVDETTFYVQVFERLPIDDISKAWVLQQGLARRQVFTITLKRVADVIASALSLIVLSPLLLAIAAAIKLSSRGPIFFNQRRQGRYSESFKMFKFRTMKIDQSDEKAGGGFTRKHDTRVTWIGRLLRPTHFDELPQLLNILKGDMSLVGPRPEALEFAKRMREQILLYELRYLVRPGLTGHAQLNQGYAMDNVLDTKTKLSYDLYYLCYHSIWMDLQLVLKTIFFLTKKAR